MWQWLKRQFGYDTKLPPLRQDTFLFVYRDDSLHLRKADPLAAEAVLIEVCGVDWLDMLAGLADPVPDGLTKDEDVAYRQRVIADRTKLLVAVEKAFGLKPYNVSTDSGVVDMGRIHILGQFCRFIQTFYGTPPARGA